MILSLALAIAITFSENQVVVENGIWSLTPLKKVTEIELPKSTLTGKWQGSAGLKIDDLSELTDVPPEILQAAVSISKQLKPIGVCSVADYSLVKIDIPLNTVTVRLFVFENAEKCKAWWSKKYEYDGWEQHYTKIKTDTAMAVRSTQMNKAAMAFGNVWLTTHQLHKGDDHIKAANHVLKQLTNGVQSLPGHSTESPSVIPDLRESKGDNQLDAEAG